MISTCCCYERWDFRLAHKRHNACKLCNSTVSDLMKALWSTPAAVAARDMGFFSLFAKSLPCRRNAYDGWSNVCTKLTYSARSGNQQQKNPKPKSLLRRGFACLVWGWRAGTWNSYLINRTGGTEPRVDFWELGETNTWQMEPFSASFAAQKLSKILTHRAYVREPIILIFFFCFVFFFLFLIFPSFLPVSPPSLPSSASSHSPLYLLPTSSFSLPW